MRCQISLSRLHQRLNQGCYRRRCHRRQTDSAQDVNSDPSATQTPEMKPAESVVARSEAPAPVAPPSDIPDSLKKFAPLMCFETTGNQDARPLEAPPSIDTVKMEDAAKELEKGETKPGRKPIDIKSAMSLRTRARYIAAHRCGNWFSYSVN